MAKMSYPVFIVHEQSGTVQPNSDYKVCITNELTVPMTILSLYQVHVVFKPRGRGGFYSQGWTLKVCVYSVENDILRLLLPNNIQFDEMASLLCIIA